jgi:hypothetical protein
MNGVIDRLVLRALPTPGGIRPQLGSRFEQEAAAPPAEFAAEVQPDRKAERDGEPAIVAPRDPATAFRSALPPLPPSGAAARVEEAAPVVVRVRDRPHVDEPDVRPGRRGPPVAAPPPVQLGIPATPGAVPQPTPIGMPVALRVEPQPIVPVGIRSDPALQTPLLPPMTGPEPVASTGELPRLQPGRTDAAQPPDVRISIGRIDIRAVRPERRPQPTRPPRPAFMSLEDYLGKGRTRP